MNNNSSLHPLSDVKQEIKKRKYDLAVKRGYISLLRNMLIMAALIFIVFSYVFTITTVHGTGMFPALLDGDLLLGYRLETEYLKNDIVICDINGETVIGRVVAKAGDVVNITDDESLFVNGTEQKGEIVFMTNPKSGTFPYTVPENSIYILGDFRTDTFDSRDFGAVDLKNVKAEVVTVLRKRGI